MKFRQTVQLGAALLLLVLLYFGQQLLSRQSDAMVEAEKAVFEFSPEDVRKIEIHQLDQEPTVGVRLDESRWEITEPNPTIRPYHPLWNSVAEALADLKNQRTLPEGALDDAAYGLEVPRLTVVAEVAGTTHTLRFGYLEPTQTLRYARLDEGGVFLADKDAVFALDRSLDLLRDSFVVENREAPIVHLEFARYLSPEEAERMDDPTRVGEESAVVVLERADGESPWTQLEPVHVAANQAAVDALVTEIQTARGRAHVDAPESFSDYGLEPPRQRITVVDNVEGYPQTFYFGEVNTEADKGGVYVRKEGDASVFLMDGHILTLFPRTTNSFRERRILTRMKSPVHLERIAGDDSYTLALGEDGAWTMTNPALDDTDPFFVNQFISALKTIEGTRFYPGAPEEYGLDTPEATFRIQLEGVEEPVELRIGPAAEVEGHYYVLTDAGEVASVPQEHLQFLLTSAQAFRDRALLRFDALRAVKMSFRFDGVDYVLEKAHNRWLVTSPAGYFMPNQRDAENLLTAVSRLRASGAEEENPEAAAEYGFEAPRFEFSVTLSPLEADGTAETVGPLVVGAVVPGIDQERFARSAARDGVFLIKQAFVEAVQSAVAGIRRKPGAAEEGN